MAPSTKKETANGTQQEPQIPENSYPFSQKFRPQPQADTSLTTETTEGEASLSPTPSTIPLATEAVSSSYMTEPKESANFGEESTPVPNTTSALTPTEVIAPQGEDESTAPAPTTLSQKNELIQESFDDAAPSQDTALTQGTLPSVPPQNAVAMTNSRELSDSAALDSGALDDKDTLSNNASNRDTIVDSAEPQPASLSSGAAIPMPSSSWAEEAPQAIAQVSPQNTSMGTYPGKHPATTHEQNGLDEAAQGPVESSEHTPPLTGQVSDEVQAAQPFNMRAQASQSELDEQVEKATEDSADEPSKKPTDKQDTSVQQEGAQQKKSRFNRKPKKTPSKQKTSSGNATPSQKASLSFTATHPILPVPPSMPGGLSNALFTTCSYAPWLFLTALFVVQTLFTLDVRALWYSDEVRHAAVFTSMLQEGNIFKLELNGQLYPDKPSLYFWFLRGLYEIIHEEGPRLYFGAAAISGLLFLWATLLLGRLVGRFDGRSLFAGGILLICGSYFMGVTHYARMDLLFSTFILGSYIAFFLAFTKNRSPLIMSLAFVLGALACLTKGPLGLALPLSALVLFALWRGKITRFFSLDFLIGLLAASLLIGGWLAGLANETSLAYIQEQILGKQVLERAVDAFHHKAKWSYYLERLPVLLMPWVAIILCLPFHKFFSKKFITIIKESRASEREGQAFLWCIVLSALMLLSVISTKIIIYLLPALPAMCLIAGRAVLQLAGKRATAFKLLLGLTLLLGGAALFIATLKVFGSFPLPDFIDKNIPAWEIPTSAGFFISTGIFCATALFLLLGLPSSRPEGVLLTLALMSTALAYPLFGMAAPSLDAILSPKAQGELFKKYIAEGYHPLTYDMYDGIYTYYAKSNIDEVYSLDEITAALEKHPRLIIAIQQRALKKLPNMPECLEPIHKQMIEQHEYVLLACPPLENGNPQEGIRNNKADDKGEDKANNAEDNLQSESTANIPADQSPTRAEGVVDTTSEDDSTTAIPGIIPESDTTTPPGDNVDVAPKTTVNAHENAAASSGIAPEGTAETTPELAPNAAEPDSDSKLGENSEQTETNAFEDTASKDAASNPALSNNSADQAPASGGSDGSAGVQLGSEEAPAPDSSEDTALREDPAQAKAIDSVTGVSGAQKTGDK